MSVTKRPDGSFRARYRDATGREHARHFPRRKDAEAWVASVTVTQARGEWVDPARAKVTVQDWSAQWLAGQVQLKVSTHRRYRGLLEVQVLPTWGPVQIGSVAHNDVAQWVQRMTAAGLSASTVRQAHRVFSLVLELAVMDGRLARNPAKGVRLPRVVAKDKRFLSHEEVARLAQECGSRGVVVRVLAYTGLRWGELAALRVGRVELHRRRLLVAASVTEVDGVSVFGTPKSHQRRTVPLPGFLVDELTPVIEGRAPSELVFTGPGGGVLRVGNFRRDVFDRAAARAGVAGLTPHGLRHTAASLAIGEGANVKLVQRMLGHASAAMTLDVYADLFDSDHGDLADRLDAAVRLRAAPAAAPRDTVPEPFADFLRTFPASNSPDEAPRGQSYVSDQHERPVGQVGLEPTTDGL